MKYGRVKTFLGHQHLSWVFKAKLFLDLVTDRIFWKNEVTWLLKLVHR